MNLQEPSYIKDNENVFEYFRWLEDFSKGKRFSFGKWEMSREAMVAFATFYDPEPHHLDEQYAKDMGWEALMASGLQVVSIWHRMLKDAFPNLQIIRTADWDKVLWVNPVYPGYVLSCDAVVSEVQESAGKGGDGEVVVKNDIKNQFGTTVCVIECRWIVRRNVR